MAVAFEDSVIAAGETATLVPAGTDRRAWILATDDNTGNSAVAAAATFKTTETYTQIGESANAAGQYISVLQADAETSSGSGTASIADTDIAMDIIGAIALSGVDQTTPSDGLEQLEATATSASLAIASAVGDLVVGCFSVNHTSNPFLTASGDSPTEREDGSTGSTGIAIVTCPGAAGDVNIGGSWTGSVRSTLIAFNVNAAGGASARPILIGGRLVGRGLTLRGLVH